MYHPKSSLVLATGGLVILHICHFVCGIHSSRDYSWYYQPAEGRFNQWSSYRQLLNLFAWPELRFNIIDHRTKSGGSASQLLVRLAAAVIGIVGACALIDSVLVREDGAVVVAALKPVCSSSCLE